MQLSRKFLTNPLYNPISSNDRKFPLTVCRRNIPAPIVPGALSFFAVTRFSSPSVFAILQSLRECLDRHALPPHQSWHCARAVITVVRFAEPSSRPAQPVARSACAAAIPAQPAALGRVPPSAFPLQSIPESWSPISATGLHLPPWRDLFRCVPLPLLASTGNSCIKRSKARARSMAFRSSR